MTQSALPAGLSVRADTAQGLPGLVVQRAGTEEDPTPRQAEAGHEQQGKQPGEDPAAREATQSVPFHRTYRIKVA
jgi:hypothetical protein